VLPGDPVAAHRAPAAVLVLALLALSHCAGAKGSEATGSSREAILDGVTVASPDAPVLFVNGPQGSCTATLIAPTLVLTARHCIAQAPGGDFACTPQGDLVPSAGGAGQIGANDAPPSLSFFSNARVVAGTAFSGNPDALGSQIISSNTPTSCRDDIAFVVLDRAIPGIPPAPVRLDTPTSAGEMVSAWGYGLTTMAGDSLALRVRNDAQIVGVGPDTPASGVQPAPLRAVRLGPDDITCIGDSGGPITSAATGAVIAIISLGTQANLTSPTCTNSGAAETTGPRLAEYKSLALAAFAAAGASPVPEGSSVDASAPEAGDDAGPDGAESTEGGQELTPESAPPGPRIFYRVTGGSCSMAQSPRDRSGPLGALLAVFTVMATAVRRRRRSCRGSARGECPSPQCVTAASRSSNT
jgi:Trypsin